MASLPVLEVAIGLAFVYLLLGLIVTTVTEWVARIWNSRGKYLEDGVRRLVGDDKHDSGITKALLDHPLVQCMSRTNKPPAYISSKVFAQAFIDVVGERQAGTTNAAADGAHGHMSPALSRTLQALAKSAPPDAAASHGLPSPEVLQEWFDQQMERVSGWYKRHTQTVALLAAALVTVAINADTLDLGRRLWSDSSLRATIVESAKARIEQGPPLQTVEYVDPTNPVPTEPISPSSTESASGDPNHLSASEQALLGNLMGWTGESARLSSAGFPRWFFPHVVGWFVTALAVSLGAPFWFDTLNKFMNLRAAGPPPPTTQPTGKR